MTMHHLHFAAITADDVAARIRRIAAGAYRCVESYDREDILADVALAEAQLLVGDVVEADALAVRAGVRLKLSRLLPKQ